MTEENEENTESTPDKEEEDAGRRVLLPLLIPAGAFLFAVLLVYGLSRIYLDLATFEVGEDVNLATPLAIIIALAILGVAWYMAAARDVPRWQIVGIGAVAVALLVGGGIWSAVYEEEEAAADQVTNGAETPEPSDEVVVQLGDNFFEFQGQQEPAIPAAAGEAVTLDLSNEGLIVHNMHIAGPDNSYDVTICETGGDEPCSDPDVMQAGDMGTISFQFDEAGTFDFRCDFHPIEMVGTIVVQ